MPNLQQRPPNSAISGVAPSCAWDWLGNAFNWTRGDCVAADYRPNVTIIKCFRLNKVLLFRRYSHKQSKRYGGCLLCRRTGDRLECGNEERFARFPTLHGEGDFWLDPTLPRQ